MDLGSSILTYAHFSGNFSCIPSHPKTWKARFWHTCSVIHATYYGFQSHLPSFQAGLVPPGWLHEAVNAYYTLDSLATFVWIFLVFPCKFQPILEEPQNTWGRLGNWGSWGKIGKIGEDGEVSAQCAGLHIPKPTIFLRVGRLSDSGFRVWKHICWT